MLKHTRHQLPVGQGFFHVGKVRLGSRTFRYVFDCGSLGATHSRNRQVSNYAAVLQGNERVGALFISHLHEDHVNGIPLLTRKLHAPIDRVILPYIHPAMRVLIASRAQRADVDYLQLVANPARYFLENEKAERVIYVTGGRPNELPLNEVSPRRPRGLDPIHDYGETPDDADLELVANDSQVPASTDGVDGRDLDGGLNRLSFMSDIDSLSLVAGSRRAMWDFVTYVDACDVDIPTLEAAIKGEGIDLDAVVSGDQRALNLVNDKKLKGRLKSCYDTAVSSKDFNVSSMSLFSGAAKLDGLADYRRVVPPGSCWPCPDVVPCVWSTTGTGHLTDRTGWIATGDAHLGPHHSRQIARWESHYRRFNGSTDLLKNAATFVLPHHGSINNFSIGLVDSIGPATVVVSAGAKSNHGHPHPRVMEELLERGHCPFVITEASGVGLIEAFAFLP